MPAARRLLVALLSLLLCAGSPARAQELKLPNLGESSTSMFSAEFEHQLGRTWLRIFRSQVPTVDDPLLHDYLEHLIYLLASHSKLEDRRIEVVVVDSPEINAFAVPGGVIGINSGLLLYAQTEDELVTVLSHEIAHLSQRHFSRGVEFQQKNQPLTLAAMLASFVLLATVGGDAGMAALSATQAAAQNSALRYSRTNEQEADRVGMQTLVDAGFDPHAAPSMFERMMQASRYSNTDRIPEFLRTHPLSENRIADTRNRARQYPKREPSVSLDYQLMRARVGNQLATSPAEAIQKFRSELAGTPRSAEAATYGLVLALTAAGKTDQAGLELDGIWSKNPDRVEYIIADAEIDMARNQPDKAAAKLAARLKVTPGNHALTMTYARALMMDQKPHIAEEVLVAQSKLNPGDPGLWYLLAEVQGLAGNIVGLHQARAEYFILNGNLDQAEKQLTYALKLTRGDYLNSAKINQRMADIAVMRTQMDG
ncbi:MAG: M48 family metalloprotease [Halieaceae bacterium]|nr:M48 family metalloprotease [Halieaceae bacterium]